MGNAALFSLAIKRHYSFMSLSVNTALELLGRTGYLRSICGDKPWKIKR